MTVPIDKSPSIKSQRHPLDELCINEDLIDFNVYSLCGDGCMMEGISSEAASLAGHWKPSNLCWIYDNNHVTIEGNTALAFTEDVATRFTGTRRHPYESPTTSTSGG